MIVACDGSVSGAAVRAAVNRIPAAASRSSAGLMPAPSRSARQVSIVTSTMFGCAEAGRGGDGAVLRQLATASGTSQRTRRSALRQMQPRRREDTKNERRRSHCRPSIAFEEISPELTG